MLLSSHLVPKNTTKCYHRSAKQYHEMENQLETSEDREKKYYTFPRRSSPVGRGTTKGGAILPEENTSVNAPVTLFMII